ncbi:MAG: hypothetical protein GY875_09780 [Gammaproteobacteria bacterium]|nr:hypothetical protein [Gammaproteobacteria bacterium]
MTLVLLDTNAYLRLAKRIKPLLGVSFGQKNYTLTILKAVEDEVHRSTRLAYQYPWFDGSEYATERLAKSVRLSRTERGSVEAATSVLRSHALENATTYVSRGRSPPSYIDCYCLAFGQIRNAIVATDDLGMHQLARDFDITIFHCHDVLKKMLTAKLIDKDKVREIFEALEINDDMTQSWKAARHTSFKKIFGPKK